ncbi:uncharacterized protein LOC128548369 [Mercenaria mercenaria]|uniref:uncharacterized protein LOC128548369 n=1 Tax=Mercenaria mercenaria TaxID=6596 RepID=UPI00234F2B07|nr:uncharacterized protein LOC128548369 [Mercenaria mercenaria]
MEAKAGETTGTTQNATEIHLDDEKQPKDDHFQGATLEINGDGAQPHAEAEVEFAGPRFDRNRPGSTIGRQSVRSTSSRTSLKAGGYKSEKMSEQYFCYKETALDEAAGKCKSKEYKADLDGNITGTWLLTEYVSRIFNPYHD